MSTKPLEDLEPLPPWFRWMPGMLAVDSVDGRWRVSRLNAGVPITHGEPWDVPHANASGHRHPDLTDPATLGCLVGLLREVSGDVAAHTSPQWVPAGWVAWWGLSTGDAQHVAAPTEGAALWAALDAAWAMRGGA